jgi:hypothetical protein
LVTTEGADAPLNRHSIGDQRDLPGFHTLFQGTEAGSGAERIVVYTGKAAAWSISGLFAGR